MAGLNPRQLKFVERYLATGNATQSYIDAGYRTRGDSAKVCAAKLLTNANVVATLEAHRARANTAQGITAEWYAARVKLEAEREGGGASHAARVSALKLAADLLGVAESHKHQHSGPGGGAIPLANLTDADLDQLESLVARAALPAADPAGDPG